MLEGLCLSSPSEHPSQPEANVSIALTSAVIAFLLSRSKKQGLITGVSAHPWRWRGGTQNRGMIMPD